MIIRKKELRDCEAWVDVNVNSWNENLKGVVSDRILNFLLNNRDIRVKEAIANFRSDDWHYVLEDNGKVIGIMKLIKSNRDGYKDCGEIQVLYLEMKEKGKGYGRALVNKGFEVLKSKGFKKALIGCIDGNPSNGFYKHIGGKFVRQDPWDGLGEEYVENIYEYDI